MKPKNMFFVLLVALCLIFAGTGFASAETGLTNVISVSGNGTVSVAPNVADINFGVITEADDAGTAQAKNSEIVNKVINALKNSGIPDNDINTTGYYLNPKYIFSEGEAPKVSGYEVRNEITVTVRGIDLIGKIIDQAVKEGINQVQNVRFYAEGTDEEKAKALALAIKDARAKADVIAAALGKTIVGIKYAGGNWYDNTPQPIIFEKRISVGAAADSAVSTPISPGLVEIRASAEIEYIIN